MLCLHQAALKRTPLVLASSSPRRYQILTQQLCYPADSITVQPSTFAEDLNHHDFATPIDYVLETARCKAVDVWQTHVANNQSHAAEQSQQQLLLAADSVVVLGSEIIEKADSPEHAAQILRKLSGQTHTVVTAVVLMTASGNGASTVGEETKSRSKHPLSNQPSGTKLHQFHCETQLQLMPFTDEQVDAYIAMNDWQGKAGAYGVQSMAASFITSLQGDYYNAVGLPSHLLCKNLIDFLQLDR